MSGKYNGSRQPPLLQVRDLSIGFSQRDASGMARTTDALTRIRFEVHAGETLALLGESGCGKSLTALALMRLLSDNARYQSGQVLVSGGEPGQKPTDLLRLPEGQMRLARGNQLAMIFQEPASSLNPVMRIGEQIREALRLHAGNRVLDHTQEIVALLQQVGLADPERVARAYPFELSGGMKQRAMIAMALAGNPGILLADEPTTALDVTLQAQILDLLQELQQQRRMGMLLITHDIAVVAARADRVAVMYAGQIVESGPVASVLRQPAHPYTRALLAALPEHASPGRPLQALGGRVPALGAWPLTCRFAPRCALCDEHCLVEAPPWVRMTDGDSRSVHRVLCWRVGDLLAQDAAASAESESEIHDERLSLDHRDRQRDPEPHDQDVASGALGPDVLSVNDLTVRYESEAPLWQRLRQCFGKPVVLKPPVVDAISFKLAAGETLALVGESGCGKTTTARAILRLLDAVQGDVALDGQRIVGQGAKPSGQWRRDVQMVFQDPFASLDPRQRIRHILSEGPIALGLSESVYAPEALARLLERVGLSPEALDRYPHEFSGGQRQRIAIARALAVSPKVLICDEPTSALDVSVQAQILNLLQQLQAETGMAYLFITHNFGVVRYLADRVAVMQAGRIVESGRTVDVLERPVHAYTKTLLASVPVLR